MPRTTSLVFLASVTTLIPGFGLQPAWALDATPSQATTETLGITANPSFVEGLPFGGWLVYPSLFLGAVYNDNIDGQDRHRQSSLGLQIQPRLDAAWEDGIHRLAVYANGDFQLYPSHQDSSRITAKVGAAWTYSPLPDLTIRLYGDFSRANGMFSPGFWSSPYQTWQRPGAVLTDSSVFTNTYEAGIAVEKKVTDQTSIRLSGGIIYASFDRPDDRAAAKSGFPTPFNGTDYYVALRATTMLTPQIYAFIEGGADFHRYDRNVKGDSVYHVTAGLGSELIRLVRGEIYVGYQARDGSRRISGSTNQPAFGGRISYYPTQYITIAASVDQSLSFSQTPVLLPSGNGGVTQAMQSASGRTFQSRIQVDYALSQLWSAYVQGGYGQTRYSAISNLTQTQVWSAGAGLRYDLWRNMALTLEYQFNRSNSKYRQAALFNSTSSFNQNVVSVGLTYHY